MNHRIREENDGLGHPALLPDSAAGLLFRENKNHSENEHLFRSGEEKCSVQKRF